MNTWTCKKYLDKYFYEILYKNKHKKIIVFGAGAALHIMREILPLDINISYFVDNKFEDWQNPDYNVKHPLELIKEEKGTFLVIIASQHTISIKEQLNEYGLSEEVDYIDLYGKYEKVFRIAKVDYEAVEIQKFIEKIDKDVFERDEDKKEKIAIVSCCTFYGLKLYDIVLLFLLRYKGYDVSLVIDDCYASENMTIYEGITEDIKKIFCRVTNQIKNKFEKIDILYISEYGKAELNDNDFELVKEAVHANAIWQRSRKIERVMEITQEEWEKRTYLLYEENLQRIKSFFEHTHYDVINIFSGNQGQRYFYPTLGERKGVRVSSYDGDGTTGATWVTDGRASHRMDILKVIKEEWLNERQKEYAILNAQEDFAKRSYAKGDEKEIVANYQHGERKKVTKTWYDVIIPLNIVWDSAALGLNRVFATEFQWIMETLEFILKNTTASILIREHPAATLFGEYNFDNLGDKVKEKYKNERRIFVAEAKDSLNTYEYIEHCKVVLPFTSTVGVEAALLGKKVISHTRIYYDTMKFVDEVFSKEEYFEHIREALEENQTIELDAEAYDEAWITYYLGMNYDLKTDFREKETRWRKLSLQEIEKMDGVDEICMLIGEGIPICYSNLKKIV